MMHPQEAFTDHEELFIERYERLLDWALHLTNHDQGRAKDVVHDVFIKFTYARPDLRRIENLDAYLYGMLRNIYISQLRRVSQGRVLQLSIIEYDSATVGLLDLAGRIETRDQLRRVCRYACMRKETSKAGSVLILRFFHGYYPNEIAQILRGSRQAVDERLRIARSEARLYLERPDRLTFMKGGLIGQAVSWFRQQSADDLLRELRQAIFQSRKGDCLSKEEIRTIYGTEGEAPDCRTLSHVVSCPQCLDAVNHLIGLSPLSERYPTDMLGPSAPSAGKTDRGSAEDSATTHERTGQFQRRLADLRLWLRPISITAIVSLALIAAMLLARLWAPAVSAAELLRRSTLSDEEMAAKAGMIQHRIINFEERNPSSGEITTRHRIEVWQGSSQNIQARRIYDEADRLIAGEWTNPDGSRVVCHRGARQQHLQDPTNYSTKTLFENGDLWRLDISAKEFSTLVDEARGALAANAGVEEQPDAYLISYSNESDTGDGGLLKATLKLKRPDLHSVEQALLIKRGNEVREYRFTEIAFEQRPAATVAPSVFQPDQELLAPAKETAKVRAGSPRLNRDTQSAAVAELEIEAAYLLARIKADMGEQVNLARADGGRLRIDALVETEERKQEMVRALAPLTSHPAIKIEISTIAEALTHRKPSSVATAIRDIELLKGAIPVEPELRRHFTEQSGHSRQIDGEIRRFADRMLRGSRQALLHASALARLVKRFSPEAIRQLSPEAQTQWNSIIAEHAQSYRREVRRLSRELRPIFFPEESPGEAVDDERGSDRAGSTQIAEQLLRLSHEHDEVMRSAFAISTQARTGSSIKSPQFWRSLRDAERVAMTIQSLYRK
jgi:RNA polymerase sigma factor (sigma-70 family)